MNEFMWGRFMRLMQMAILTSVSSAEGTVLPSAQSTSSVITLGDSISIVLLIVTAIGIIFTGMQLKQTKDINRAILVKELYLFFYKDKAIREIFYKIEWSNYSLDERMKLDTKEEQQVDALLSFFEVICDMFYRKVLTKDDLKIFDYEMYRTYEHPGVQEYLEFLEEWQKERNIGESFRSFKRYCEENSNPSPQTQHEESDIQNNNVAEKAE